MLWGTYRPGLYFGLRPRAPKSLVFGLMWMNPLRQDALQNIRHQAQERDGLTQYGWLAHDGEGYGRQGVIDQEYNITTYWKKEWSPEESVGPLGGRWSARIGAEGIRKKEFGRNDENEDEYEIEIPDEEEGSNNDGAISFFLYVATEDGSPVEVHVADVIQAVQGSTSPSSGAGKDSTALVKALSGSTAPFGPWALHLHMHSSDQQSSTSSAGAAGSFAASTFMTLRTPHLHNLTDAVELGLRRSLQQQIDSNSDGYILSLPNTKQPQANVAVIQILATLPTNFDLVFSPESKSATKQSTNSALTDLIGSKLSKKLRTAEAAFNSRFKATFGDLSGSDLPIGTASAARAALSNLLGGMGYWHGHSLVKLPQPHENTNGPLPTPKIMKMWDASLFSATPSRSFFPRGFLWDEGFHQLLLRRWNPAMSRDALAHWLDLMTASGWIPREQILGEEARSRVPEEFIAQSPDAANPPALFLPLADMAARAAQHAQHDPDAAADLDFLHAAWPRLRTWITWYNVTQAGPLPGSYRWRGRDPHTTRELNPKTLTSGLDDYPRASHPLDEERHLDLRCWMALAAHSLAGVGAAAGAPIAEVEAFRAAAAHLDNFEELKNLHWDAKRGIFADWGTHTEAVALVDNPSPGNDDMIRLLTDEDNAPPVPQFVPHYGYLSLFPLIMGLIPKDSPELGQQLALLRQSDELWSPHGLRSLSKSSSLFGAHNTRHDAPYWRGPVWVNANYLVLRALGRYASAGGPHAGAAREAASELRSALLRTLVGQYNSRGYLYEQYDEATGLGKGSHPFTGWTALLTLIAAQPATAEAR